MHSENFSFLGFQPSTVSASLARPQGDEALHTLLLHRVNDCPGLALHLQRDGADADVAQNLAFFARNGVPSDVVVVSVGLWLPRPPPPPRGALPCNI